MEGVIATCGCVLMFLLVIGFIHLIDEVEGLKKEVNHLREEQGAEPWFKTFR